jgi:hypothetical protein
VSAVPLTEADLRAHLRRQLGFLRTSSRLYDDGALDEAVRLGVCVRILMHETRSSHSLLSQLGLRESMDYIDGCRRYRDELEVGEQVHDAALAATTHVVDQRWVPIFGSRGVRVSPLARWWDGPIELVNGELISRADLVTTMANQDGGTHVDPAIDANYLDLSQDNRGNFYVETIRLSETHATEIGPESWLMPTGSITAAAMRQIAWEVERSLEGLDLEWLQTEIGV